VNRFSLLLFVRLEPQLHSSLLPFSPQAPLTLLPMKMEVASFSETFATCTRLYNGRPSWLAVPLTVLDSYSASARFESHPGHRLSWRRCFMGFLSPFRRMLRWYLDLSTTACFQIVPNSSFICNPTLRDIYMCVCVCVCVCSNCGQRRHATSRPTDVTAVSFANI
jgi:hypothetical protein